jgi:CRISPR-associated exonuclease Cas4
MKIKTIDILNYLYCPRYVYYMYKLNIPQFEDKYTKVIKGREIHHLRTVRNKDYLRKKIGVTEKFINPYLATDNLVGIPDEVVKLQDGTMAVIDYKFSKYEGIIYEPVKQQLISYAVLTEKVFKASVNRSYIVYVRSNNKMIEVPITQKDKKIILDSIKSIKFILENDYFPEPTKHKSKCINCTYRNICVL